MDMSLLRRFWTTDLAIDIGTAAIRVSSPFHPLAESPSGRGNSRALSGGVIVDREAATLVLRELLLGTRKMRIGKLRAVACAPTDVSRAEREAVTEAVEEAGAAAVTVVPEPLAAAVGAGLDIGSHYPHFVCDIGEGVTDCAVICGGRVVESFAIRIGCDDLRRDLQRGAANLGLHMAGERAEEILRTIRVTEAGSHGEEDSFRISGKEIVFSTVRAFLEPSLNTIMRTVSDFFHDLPDRTAADIVDSGILLTGGGSLIRGMAARMEAATGLKATLAADPLHAVVLGAQAMLPAIAALHRWEERSRPAVS